MMLFKGFRIRSWLLCLALLSIYILPTVMADGATKENLVLDSETKDDANPLSEDQLKAVEDQKQDFAFETEVSRVMNIIIHSLYKSKEIFLRELISNGSDALDKIRLTSLTKSDALKSNPNLKLTIKADNVTNTLTITDSGIGMTYNDLKKNLGTIAKSGTSDFLKKFENSKSKDSTNLIGQFGVGFYSSFLVADKVQVISKHDDDVQYVWESGAISSYSIVKDPRGNTLGRGTQITLFLNEDAREFLDSEVLESLIKTYSEYIEFPIYLWTKVKTSEPAETSENEEGEESVKELVEKEGLGYKLMNLDQPIWTKTPNNVTSEEHFRLFQKLNDNIGQPLSQIHFKAEGDTSFKAILYIPELGLESLRISKVTDTPIKLHVKRVFITDNTVKLVPEWLAFLRGLVDCDDIPLNVSRETVQNSRTIRLIKKKLLAKAFELFNRLSNDEVKYQKFLGDFGPFLKRGIREDSAHQEKIAKLLRFPTTRSKVSSLDDYIERMKDGQDKIYFITGGSMEALLRSPYAEKLVSQGYEVILMDLPVDEFTMQYLTKYKKYSLVHAIAAQGDVKDDKKELEALNTQFKPLVEWFDKTLKETVEVVRLSTRLIYSPSAIIPASLGGLSGNQERLMKAQAYQSQQELETQKWLNAKKGLELNPKHPIIIKLLDQLSEGKDDQSMKDLAHLLFQTSMLRSDYDLPSPQAYADRVEKLIRSQLDLSTQLDYPDVKEAGSNGKVSEEQEPENSEDDEAIPEVDAHDEL